MKNLLIVISCAFAWPFCAHAQGTFWFANLSAPTRLESSRGSLAGSNVFAQMFVGPTSASLSPLGSAVPHLRDGIVFGGVLEVPGASAGTSVFAQMAAWDGVVWGTTLANVPANQIGYTDIVPVFLVTPTQPQLYPEFTQAAIVPVVPEPGTVSLLVLGCVALFWSVRRRRPLRRMK